MKIHTKTPEQTKELGRQIGILIAAGDCLCLSGELGAGKTLFAQGVAEGLKVEDAVTSPTFTVLQVYQGRLPVYHFDLYRLNRPEELLNIGFEEYLDSDGVALIEWPDLFPEYMPESALRIEISTTGEYAREITLIPGGCRHETLIKELNQKWQF